MAGHVLHILGVVVAAGTLVPEVKAILSSMKCGARKKK